MTYSIVARDARTGQLGVAVQSHFFGCGRVVCWAEAGIGVVATQAFALVGHGPNGVDLLAQHHDAGSTLEALLSADEAAETRQVAVLDATGAVATRTGSGCVPAAGDVQGDAVSAQGNMLVSDRAWHEMLDAYHASEGSLAERLHAALVAAEATGGDTRGRQAGRILVVDDVRSVEPWEHIVTDVRVEDHADPLGELGRLLRLDGFYRRLLRMFSQPGLLNGPATATPAEVDEALDQLAEGRALLGDNQEATVWRGILLARNARVDEARDHLASAIAERPELARYVRDLAQIGAFPDLEVVDRILPPTAPGGTT